MQPKRTKKKMPLTVLQFYVNLYCSRQISRNAKYSRNVSEATRSWYSLSESQKQEIESKFQQCKQNYRLQIFNQLKNAQLFMKSRKLNTSARRSEDTVIDLQTKECGNESEEFVHDIDQQHNKSLENCEQLICDREELSSLNETSNHNENYQNETSLEAADANNQPPQTMSMEPLPPSVRTGHELFCMLTSTDQCENVNWTSLPQLEKNQYIRAVSIMKKDYIYKYKEYLESLSSKDLFDHYNKKIS